MSSRILSEFELLVPDTKQQALELLAQHKNDVTIVSGGTDMLIAFKFGFESTYALSVTSIPDLDYLTFDAEKGLTIGARTTVSQILDSDIVKEYYPALWQAAKVFATPQIKNTATVIGNILRASPAGDCSSAIYALDGELIVESTAGQRAIPIDDVWVSYGKTAIESNELAIEVRLAPPTKTSAFNRLTRVNEDLAKLNVSANLVMDGNVCRTARLVMGCVGPTLLRLKHCEHLIEGAELNDELFEKLSVAVQDDICPIDDKRSTAQYRRQVAGVFLKRAILAASGQDL